VNDNEELVVLSIMNRLQNVAACLAAAGIPLVVHRATHACRDVAIFGTIEQSMGLSPNAIPTAALVGQCHRS
jgi:hypothetical protein